MSDRILIIARVDGWTLENCDGAPVARDPNRRGFVAFNDDMSALYVADVSEVPFSVIDALRKLGDQ